MGRGLDLQEFSGYFADDRSWFDTQTRSGSISIATSIDNLSLGSTVRSWLIDGYIIPATSATYTFRTISDDASYVYINQYEVINNGGGHGLITVENTIALTAGVNYYIRIYWGNGGGPSGLQFAWSGGDQASFTTNLTLDSLEFIPMTLQSSGQISFKDIAYSYNLGTNNPLSLIDLSNVSRQYTTTTSLTGFYGKSSNQFVANRQKFSYKWSPGTFPSPNLNGYYTATIKIVAGLSPSINGTLFEMGRNTGGNNGGIIIYMWNGVLYAQCGIANVLGGSVEVSWTIPTDWTTNQIRTIVYGASSILNGVNSLFVDGILRNTATNATATYDLTYDSQGALGRSGGAARPVNRMDPQNLAYQDQSAVIAGEHYANILPI